MAAVDSGDSPPWGPGWVGLRGQGEGGDLGAAEGVNGGCCHCVWRETLGDRLWGGGVSGDAGRAALHA